MNKSNKIQMFQKQTVRTHWDDKKELWYFSIIDVIAILADNPRPRKYWSDLKKKLKGEGSELSEKIGQLKMKATDGKMRLTDVADTEQLLRLISKEKKPDGLEENKNVARKGGGAAKKARQEIEKQTGKPIVTAKNARNLLDNLGNIKIGNE